METEAIKIDEITVRKIIEMKILTRSESLLIFFEKLNELKKALLKTLCDLLNELFSSLLILY